jgi:energy-coupling factor transporter ATP-binding protein EcfA2
MSKQNKFKKTTKLIIAMRAGYRCSFPGCGKGTVGPSPDPEDASWFGEAAHIYSVSDNGPRGHGTLNPDELKKPHNGICLCKDHHTMIDPKKGRDYPANILLSFKHFHEDQVARELGAPVCTAGWLEEVTILESPIVKTPMKISLGKATIFLGTNGVGKTTVCRYMASGSSPEAVANYLRPTFKGSHEYTLIYRAPMRHRLDITVNEQKISYRFDDTDVPFSPISMAMVTLPQAALKGMGPFASDLARIFGISTGSMKQALTTLSIRLPGKVETIRILDDDSIEVSADTVKFIPLERLSGGELKMFLLECAIALAKFSSDYHSTILVLDDGLHGLDQERRQNYLLRLNAVDCRFQTVITDVGAMKDVPWGGWQYVNF